MNKTDLLLQKLKEQRKDLLELPLITEKNKYADSIIQAVEQMISDNYFTDKNLDLLLSDEKLLITLFRRTANWHLEFESIGCAMDDIHTYLSDVNFNRLRRFDEEM